MRRKLTAAMVAAGLLALVGLFWPGGGGAALALDDVAANVRAARTVKMTVVTVRGNAGEDAGEDRMVVYWSADGRVRTDAYDDDALSESRIIADDGSALVLNHAKQTYHTEVTQANDMKRGLFALFVRAFADVPAAGAKRLPARHVSGQQFPGFEWPIQVIDADLAAGKGSVLRVWVEPTSRLPATFELVMFDEGKLTSKEIVWNAPFEAGTFDRKPPAGYTQLEPFTVDAAREKQIAHAFRTYAEVMGGVYPQVEVLYPDMLGLEVRKKLGVEGPAPKEPDKAYWDAYSKAMNVSHGFTWVWGIRKSKPEMRYYGKIVGPKDAGKVLLRWREDGGRYRVLYGDLTFATVDSTALRRAEGR